MFMEQSCDLHRKFKGGIVFIILNSNNGLSADTNGIGKIFLPHPLFLSQFLNIILHNSSPIKKDTHQYKNDSGSQTEYDQNDLIRFAPIVFIITGYHPSFDVALYQFRNKDRCCRQKNRHHVKLCFTSDRMPAAVEDPDIQYYKYDPVSIGGCF